MAWKKGQSGNPSGRPGRVLELMEMARKHCPKAIKRAVEILDSRDEKAAMAAATFLADRGMGKPAQVALDLTMVSDEALIAEVRRRAEAAKPVEARPMEPGALDA